MGLEVTALCLLLGFPFAYALSRLRGTRRALVYVLVLLPLLTSAVVRTFGWMILLANNGFINRTMMDLGLTDSPIAADVRHARRRHRAGRGAAAVHDPGARRRAAQHPPVALRGRAQPRRRPGARLCSGHAAAGAARASFPVPSWCSRSRSAPSSRPA